MKMITDTLSKEIIAVREGEIVGIATNVYTDEKLSRVRGYKVSNEERDEGALLPLRRLIGQGDALVMRTISALEEPKGAECPLGAKIYDSVGVYRGILRDLLFDEVKGGVLSLITDEEAFAPDRVITYGKRAVILRAPCHDKLVFRSSPRRPSRTEKTVSLSEEALPTPEDSTLPLSTEIEESAPLPDVEAPAEEMIEREKDSSLFKYAFLLGRTTVKDIGNEASIAKAGEIVTPDVIYRAREQGKLVELTLNSRKEG